MPRRPTEITAKLCLMLKLVYRNELETQIAWHSYYATRQCMQAVCITVSSGGGLGGGKKLACLQALLITD